MRDNFWGEFFRWAITALVYGFYIASVFFYFNSDWAFVLTFEYWTTVLSSTAFALFLRWIWSDKGLADRLASNLDIKSKEDGKDKLIGKVNSNNLTDELDRDIKEINRETKLREWNNKCDEKIKYFKRKAWWKLFRKVKLQRWKNEKDFILTDEFNLDIVKVKYYKYDIDEMMSSFYKQNSKGKRFRGNKTKNILQSYRTNMITFIAFAIMKAMEVFVSSFTKEDIFILIGQITIFTINIYSGYKLGTDFVDQDYSSDLTDDFTFLKGFLNKHKVV